MKINHLIMMAVLFIGIHGRAQERKLLSLKDAIEIAITKSTQANLATTKVATSKLVLETVKNNQYPNLKISGQYLHLTQANVTSGNLFGSADPNAEPSPSPKVEQLLLAQANLNMPLFNGFKLKYSIKASESLYKAETLNATHTKEQLGLQVVELFSMLYKSQQMVILIEDNLKSAQQRVKDFSAMEENGIIARNDLLKSQLQESNIALSLDNTKKNVSVVNYKLVTLLQLPENTQIEIDIEAVKSEMAKNQNTANGTRNDLAALQLQQNASETGVKIAQSNYYPSLSLLGGYIAFNLKNVLEVNNAINIGVGLSYDLSSIFKNGKEVKLASSRASETKLAVRILSDKIKEEEHEAMENYSLSQKQSLVYDKAVEQATENYRIVKDKYDNSLSTTNDLLEADVEQLQSKINQALSKADVAQKYYELQFATGKLISSLNLSQN